MVATTDKDLKTQPQMVSAQLAPTLDELYNHFVTELSKDGESKYSIEELTEMLKYCPINRLSIKLLALRAVVLLGEYKNADSTVYPTASGKLTIQEWVRGNFESMKGSLLDVCFKLVRQVYGLGASCGEIVWTKKSKGSLREWRLKKIKILNRRKYDFAGKFGEVDRIIFRSRFLGQFAIPYSKLLHVYSPSIDEPEDPRGEAQSSTAYPFFKARQLGYMQWSTAGQRQATGFLVVKVPSEKTVVVNGKDGQPELKPDGTIKTQPAAQAAANAAKNIENGSVFVTDKENDIMPVVTGAGEGFFSMSQTHYEKMIFYCYGIPSTIFGDTASGIGNAGINAGHRMILDTQIEGLVQMLRDELVEKVVRPLLLANFGSRFEDNLGYFEVEKFLDPMQVTGRVSNLLMAFANGIIDNTEIEAINRLRQDLGLSAISKEQFDRQALEKLLAQQEAEQASYPEEKVNNESQE